MSQISKCPKLRVVLGYWEALGEVSELRYKNLLYSSSKRSYCSAFSSLMQITSVLEILQLDVRRALHKVKWVRQAAQAPKALLDG